MQVQTDFSVKSSLQEDPGPDIDASYSFYGGYGAFYLSFLERCAYYMPIYLLCQ